MKNIFKTFILSLALCSLVGGNIVQAYEDVEKKYNATRVSATILNLNNTKNNKFDDFWSTENQSFLNEEEINYLNKIKEKFESGSILTFQENKYLKSLKNKVIRQKLGEEKYKELEKLIEKRESSTDLTIPERKRIYELNKECR